MATNGIVLPGVLHRTRDFNCTSKYFTLFTFLGGGASKRYETKQNIIR